MIQKSTKTPREKMERLPKCYFKTFAKFNTMKLSANAENTAYTVGVPTTDSDTVTEGEPEIYWQQQAYIENTSQIWTHGHLFGMQPPVDVTALMTEGGRLAGKIERLGNTYLFYRGRGTNISVRLVAGPHFSYLATEELPEMPQKEDADGRMVVTYTKLSEITEGETSYIVNDGNFTHTVGVPAASDEEKAMFLRGDGQWAEPTAKTEKEIRAKLTTNKNVYAEKHYLPNSWNDISIVQFKDWNPQVYTNGKVVLDHGDFVEVLVTYTTSKQQVLVADSHSDIYTATELSDTVDMMETQHARYTNDTGGILVLDIVTSAGLDVIVRTTGVFVTEDETEGAITPETPVARIEKDMTDAAHAKFNLSDVNNMDFYVVDIMGSGLRIPMQKYVYDGILVLWYDEVPIYPNGGRVNRHLFTYVADAGVYKYVGGETIAVG